jgi:hypothetical protein
VRGRGRGAQRRRERWPHQRCSEEGVRRSGRDRWPGRARPYVDGASPGVVEGWPGGDAPALAGSRCSGAAGAAATVGAAAATPAAITTAPTTTATATSAEGSRRSRTAKGAGEDGGRHCWAGVGEGRCCCPPEAGVSSSRRRSLWTLWKDGNGRTCFR